MLGFSNADAVAEKEKRPLVVASFLTVRFGCLRGFHMSLYLLVSIVFCFSSFNWRNGSFFHPPRPVEMDSGRGLELYSYYTILVLEDLPRPCLHPQISMLPVH